MSHRIMPAVGTSRRYVPSAIRSTGRNYHGYLGSRTATAACTRTNSSSTGITCLIDTRWTGEARAAMNDSMRYHIRACAHLSEKRGKDRARLDFLSGMVFTV